jgi:hypothetical protein
MSNTSTKGNKTLNGLILILIIICSLTAFYAFNTHNQLNNLQSSFNRLSVDYSNLQSKLNNMESSLNSIGDDILLNSSQERLSIVFVRPINENSVTVRTKSLTGVDIVVVDAIIRDHSDKIIAQNNRQMSPTILPAMGGYKTIEISFQNLNFPTGMTYSITLITQKGNSFTDSFITTIPTSTPAPQPSTP